MRRGGAPFRSESPTLPVVNPALEATGRWAGGGGGGASQSGPRLSRSFGVCGRGHPSGSPTDTWPPEVGAQLLTHGRARTHTRARAHVLKTYRTGGAGTTLATAGRLIPPALGTAALSGRNKRPQAARGLSATRAPFSLAAPLLMLARHCVNWGLPGPDLRAPRRPQPQGGTWSAGGGEAGPGTWLVAHGFWLPLSPVPGLGSLLRPPFSFSARKRSWVAFCSDALSVVKRHPLPRHPSAPDRVPLVSPKSPCSTRNIWGSAPRVFLADLASLFTRRLPLKNEVYPPSFTV